MGQRVGERDVIERDLDILDSLLPALEGTYRALMLVQEGDRIDEGQILLMIAPQPRGLIREGQPLRIWVQYLQRFQQPLCVLVQRAQGAPRVLGFQPREGPPLALQAVY